MIFTGKRMGLDLAEAYASADVFVFPSVTDTFGIVLIEAMSAGVPVAAFPVTGPIDIIGPDGRGVDTRTTGPAGVLDEDLEQAIGRALMLRREDAASLGAQFSWERATDQFLHAMEEVLVCGMENLAA